MISSLVTDANRTPFSLELLGGEKMSTERFKTVTSFVTNLLNNKTIILRNRAEYRLILSRQGRRPSRLKSDDIPQD